MIGFGFVKEQTQEKKTKQMDELATNDSIFMDEK